MKNGGDVIAKSFCQCMSKPFGSYKNGVSYFLFVLVTVLILQIMVLCFFIRDLLFADLRYCSEGKECISNFAMPPIPEEEADDRSLDEIFLSSINGTLPCTEYLEDARSAIKEAQTEECQMELANVSCLGSQKKLFSLDIPRTCSEKSVVLDSEETGCYLLYENNLEPPNSLGQFEMSKEGAHKCTVLCYQQGHRYAVMSVENCLCAHQIPQNYHIREAEPEDCNFEVCMKNDTCVSSAYLFIDTKFDQSNKMSSFEYKPGSASKNVDLNYLFFMMVEGRDLRQIKRLFKIIYRPYHYYYIHVDLDSEYLQRSLQEFEKYPNIKFASDRYSVLWGGTSHFNMVLNSFKEIFTIKDWEWNFMISLRGTDFPTRYVDQLEQYLLNKLDKNFINFNAVDSESVIKKHGLDLNFHECDSRMWKVSQRDVPQSISFHTGDDDFIFNYNFCKYVALGNDKLRNNLIDMFQHTILPLEGFFHTLLTNSKFCSSIVHFNLKYANWGQNEDCYCSFSNKDWCSCSPVYIPSSATSYFWKLNYFNVFFSGTFEPRASQKILNELDEEMEFSSYQKHASFDTYWGNLYHHLDETRYQSNTVLSIYSGIVVVAKDAIAEASFEEDLLDETCEIYEDEILQIYSHHNNDENVGLVLQMEATVKYENKTNHVLVEVFASLKDNKVLDDPENHLADRITIQIGSNYDRKSKLFTNLDQIFGQDSSLAFQIKVSNNRHTQELVLIILDPNGFTIVVEQIYIAEGQLKYVYEAKMDKPMKTGIWKLKVMERNTELFTTTYTIFPEMSDDDFRNTEKVQEMKRLILSQFDIYDYCYAPMKDATDFSFPCEHVTTERCEMTAWSSLFPDPKSQIYDLDKDTQRFI